jgi:TorA maturation chaperone TorD
MTMDKVDLMEVNEKQRERIDHLITALENMSMLAGRQWKKVQDLRVEIEKMQQRIDHLITVIENKDMELGQQWQKTEDLKSVIENMQHQIDQQTDWRNYVQ